MANYLASARSNKFRVKDIAALEAAMPEEIEVYIEDAFSRQVCLLVTDGNGGGWPSFIYNEEAGKYDEWDVEEAVAPHLEDGEWCVIREVGAEKLRYLIGYTTAFNNKGEMHTISLEDIYKLLPDGVSGCEY